MSLKITIDNYEEIMFRLVEDNFDKPTRTDLLQQIERDELFKFEWEAWQKTRFDDPIENYTIESQILTEKIILIAEPEVSGRKRIIYYWAAAASALVLIGTLLLLTADFSSTQKPDVAATDQNKTNPLKNAKAPVKSQLAHVVISDQKQIRNQKREIQTPPVSEDSIPVIPAENTLVQILQVVDPVPVKINELAKAPEKKPRFSITIETSDIEANIQDNNEVVQNQKVKIKKVFTNTKMLLRRKPNGEPDKIYIIGDENSYLCINLNY